MNPETSQEAVEAVVKQTLELPRSDQLRVTEILSALVSPGQPVAAERVEPSTEPASEPSVFQWLEGIAGLPAWERLGLLDDALERTAPGPDTDAVLTARKILMDNNPPLAIRAGVTRIFEEHPGMATLGVLGLSVGLIALGRGFFRLIF